MGKGEIKMNRVTDYELREVIKDFNEKKKEELINKLSVSHTIFNNWFEGKDSLGSENRNLLRHLVMGSL